MKLKRIGFGPMVFCLAAILTVLSAAPLARAEVWSTPFWLDEINTGDRDLEPWISADGKTLYFSSGDPGWGSSDLDNLQIWVSHLGDDGFWATPEMLPEPLNDPNHRDGHPSLTLDGRYMFFHSSRPGGHGGTDAETGLDIWMSENIEGEWQEPINMGPYINSSMIEKDPFISVDGQRLYYSRGAGGNRELVMSRKLAKTWQPPINLGPTINTEYNDGHPSLSYTGKYLFFAVGGSGNQPSDVYRATKKNGFWQAPVLLPSPVNTPQDEEASIFNDCTNTLYFYSLDQNDAHWDIATSVWTDNPNDNPCEKLIIPEGEWRVRVTLLEASAVLKNDIYIDDPIQKRLIKNSLKNIGTVVTTPFLSAEELIFHISVDGGPMGLGKYDHYSNGQFARVERTDPLRYIVGFEDLPADMADWDFNDTVLLIELIGVEINIWETENYLGESQVIEETFLNEDTNLAIPMEKGIATDLAVNVPGAGLVEATYGAVVEGDPALYKYLLDDAPFESTGTFFKIELMDGLRTLKNGESNAIHVEFDDPFEGDEDWASMWDIKLYRLDPETAAWIEVEDQETAENNTLYANSQDVGLFALGATQKDTGSNTYKKSDSGNDGGWFGCALAAGHEAGPAGAAPLALILLIGLSASIILGKTGNRKDNTE